MFVDMVSEPRSMIIGFLVSLCLTSGFQYFILWIVIGKQPIIGLYPDTAESVFQNESVSFFRSLYIAYQAGGILGKVDAPYLILSVEYPQNAVVRLVEFVDAPSFVSRRKNDGEVVVVFAEKQLLRGCDAQAMILRLIEAVDAVDSNREGNFFESVYRTV